MEAVVAVALTYVEDQVHVRAGLADPNASTATIQAFRILAQHGIQLGRPARSGGGPWTAVGRETPQGPFGTWPPVCVRGAGLRR